MITIPFTQYLRPSGRAAPVEVDVPENIGILAETFMAEGGRYEAEVLSTGHVSLTAVHIVGDEDQNVAIEVVQNGPQISDAVNRLVHKSVRWLEKEAA